jgi:hypothetical protein
VCASGTTYAGSVVLDNGVTGTGHLDISVDDFGSYGRWIGPNDDDAYQPPNYQREDPMTTVSTVYVFPAVQGHKGAVELTGFKILHNLVEGGNGDGISGDYANLTRTVTTGITTSNGVAHSAFNIADTATGLNLNFALDQQITVLAMPVSRLEQVYQIDNAGPDAVLINFHAIWDMNILYTGASADDDIVGVPPGLCYMYMRDPGSTVFGGAFEDGGSEVGTPTSLNPIKPMAYYGAKQGVLPEGTLQPAFSVSTSGSIPVWTGFKMPPTWFNQLADVGKNMPGETTTVSEAMVGYEYQFLLNAGGRAKIRLFRYYGTTALPCTNVGVNCGNNTVDAGEACDSATDTPTCNANMCTAPMCGDNYVNTAAGETCESNGIDSADCNGAGPCTAPSCGDGYVNTAANEACDDGANTATCNLTNCQPPTCGDGIINDAAGEECDSNELCTDDCHWSFSLGGGCAGCASSGPDASLLLLLGLPWLGRRRRVRRA